MKIPKNVVWMILGISISLSAGCSRGHEEALQQENQELKARIGSLEEQLQEKDKKIESLEVPDKVAYDEIDQEWIQMGGVYIEPSVKTEDITALIQKFFDFTVRFPASPLTENAKKRIESLKKVIERQEFLASRKNVF